LRRFFISHDTIADGTITITGELFRHMATVLRLKQGTRVSMADGSGHEYVGTIARITIDSLEVAIEETCGLPDPDPGPRISLFQGLPKGDKLELILQKATELGAAEIVPFVAARSIARFPEGRLAEKLERWQRISREAARQSGRPSVPHVCFARDMDDVLSRAEHAVRLLLWEGEKPGSLRKLLAQTETPESIAIIVGPEGGLAPEEVLRAISRGFAPVSLGKRILRTETAGLAILTILQYHWGDIG
jgi:16S rRNA (uracil1498-N3)-methyltransferase